MHNPAFLTILFSSAGKKYRKKVKAEGRKCYFFNVKLVTYAAKLCLPAFLTELLTVAAQETVWAEFSQLLQLLQAAPS